MKENKTRPHRPDYCDHVYGATVDYDVYFLLKEKDLFFVRDGALEKSYFAVVGEKAFGCLFKFCPLCGKRNDLSDYMALE